MPAGTSADRAEHERPAIERAVAFAARMRDLAPAGQALSAREGRALGAGRGPLRSTPQQAAQARIDAAEQEGGPPAPARAPARSASGGAAGAR